MSVISDETLMAYADGEIDAEERARVDAYLRSSPEGQRRLAIYKATGREISALFGDIAAAPLPERLIEAVRVSEGPGTVVNFPGGRRTRRTPGAGRPAFFKWALAASIAAIAIGVGAGVFSGLSRTDESGLLGVADLPNGQRVAVGVLGGVLDQVPSGRTSEQSLDGTKVMISPVFSFATDNDGYCRQYELNAGPRGSFGGVACRAADGQWIVKTQVSKTDAPTDAGKIVPAGREGVPEIEATVDGLISGDVLGVADEKILIEGRWKAPTP